MINMAINPLTVAPLLMGLVASHMGLQGDALGSTILVAVLGYLVIPLVFLLLLKRSGRIASIEARDRERRSGPLWVGAGILTVAGAAVVWTSGSGYGPLFAVSLILVLNALLAAAINERFKMSLHVSSVAGLFSMLWALTWISGQRLPGGAVLLIGAALLIPLLMWARKADHAHSGPEVRVGALFGLVIPAVEVFLLHAVWPLYG